MADPTKIGANQVAYKKKIGTLDGHTVFEVGLIGGLHLILKAKKSGQAETLGAGPHRAIARHIAKKRNPDLQLTELSKSDYWPESTYEHLLPKYEALTDRFRSAK